MTTPHVSRSAGASAEQQWADQVAVGAQARKHREAAAISCGLRADWAREFSNSELDDYVSLAETVNESRKPFNLYTGGLVLTIIIVLALLLSLQGCGGGDPEPIDEAPTPHEMRGPHEQIRPVLHPECEDHEHEGTEHSQQWHDQCDGAKT